MKNDMKKIIYLLTLTLGMSLAACSDDTIPVQPEKPEPEKPVDIRVYKK